MLEILTFNSEQDLFDKSVEHLAKQGKPCAVRLTSGTRSCRYRHGTLACVIGCHLSDETAAALDSAWPSCIEDIITNEIIHVCGPNGLRSPALETLMMSLQPIHDECRDLRQLKRTLNRLAAIRQLNPAKVELITKWEA